MNRKSGGGPKARRLQQSCKGESRTELGSAKRHRIAPLRSLWRERPERSFASLKGERVSRSPPLAETPPHPPRRRYAPPGRPLPRGERRTSHAAAASGRRGLVRTHHDGRIASPALHQDPLSILIHHASRRLASLRASVRRCMPSLRAASETLKSASTRVS